jgi:hypothetical protein
MAEGRDRHDWRHTAEVLAMLLNVNKTKGRWLRGADLDPHAAEDGRLRQEGMPINGRTLPAFIDMMLGRRRGKGKAR